jgi:hypothetical protein
MKIREYIKVMPLSSENPDPATYCPANGYILDPNVVPTPLFEIPPGETNEKIILIVSSELDSAVSFSCYITNTGQFKTQVYDMEGNIKYTVNTANNGTLNLELPTSYGTLQPEGYYLFKIVITPVLGTNSFSTFKIASRTGFAVNGWPVKEMHIYAPNLTSASGLTSALCKIMTFAKFYTNCNSLSSLANAFSGCTLLKKIILPPQMNALTLASYMFLNCSSLLEVVWPTSLPEITSLASCFSYAGLKKCTPTNNPLPVSMPKLAAINNMFDYNNVIEEIEIPNDLPLLTNMSNFVLFSNKIKTVKFTGTIGESTAGVLFDWIAGYNPALTQFTFPPVFYCKGGGQATQFKSCSALQKVVLPPTITYYITSLSNFSIFGRFEECVNLTQFTEITSGGNTVCVQLFFTSTKKLAVFWQPKLRLYGANMNATSTNRSILASFECDWSQIQASNSLNGTIIFMFAYCNFDVNEINRIFTALPTVTRICQIDFRNNPGYASCDKTIATAKGWTVS